MSDIYVAALDIYPIKSCAHATIKRENIHEAYVSARGLVVGNVADRRFMLVDDNYGFLSQRKVPILARVKVGLLQGSDGAIDKSLVSAAGAGDFLLDSKDASDTRAVASMHRGEKMPVHLMNGPGSEWFREFLGRRDVHLVYQTDDDIRISDRNFAAQPDAEHPMSLGDGFPVLLTSMPTLAKFNDGLGVSKPMNRFRPNVTVGGDLAPNEENTFALAQYGDVRMYGVKPCTRCVMIGVDQETGIQEGSNMLVELGRTSRVNYEHGAITVAGLIFGENLVPDIEGPLRLGDKVTVLERKPMLQFKAA